MLHFGAIVQNLPYQSAILISAAEMICNMASNSKPKTNQNRGFSAKTKLNRTGNSGTALLINNN